MSKPIQLSWRIIIHTDAKNDKHFRFRFSFWIALIIFFLGSCRFWSKISPFIVAGNTNLLINKLRPLLHILKCKRIQPRISIYEQNQISSYIQNYPYHNRQSIGNNGTVYMPFNGTGCSMGLTILYFINQYLLLK